MSNGKLEKLGSILFLSAIVFFVIFLLLQPSDGCLKKKNLLNHDLNGVVVEKFYDIKFSNVETIRVFNFKKYNHRVVCGQELKPFFNYTQIGDSIYKPKGILEIKLFREDFDTTFIFNYDCDKW
ncbi:MAG: hypothetical protein H6578_01845 [Chitinophagales bacterium]|nr:hypothetical protein [Chitinophagales bacterium]